MSQDTRFTITYDAYKNNICSGLSSLQENEEFVDMTLAADGHYVKVHQVVMALASPYIKELLTAAPCQHPIIFLNKISYKALQYLLEYIYQGEVSVDMEQLNELFEVARELHIQGLESMDINTLEMETEMQGAQENSIDEKICVFEVIHDAKPSVGDSTHNKDEIIETHLDKWNDQTEESTTTKPSVLEKMDTSQKVQYVINENFVHQRGIKNIQNSNVIQYTVSNQGSLQMILNRFVYYLKHTNLDRSRQWRCVDYVSKIKCPATVFTQGDMVLQRIASHIHPFHDKKILKKARENAIFSAIQEAQIAGENRKSENVKTVEVIVDE